MRSRGCVVGKSVLTETGTRRTQEGLTLVETLIAVVIGIIILVGAFIVAGQVLSNNRLSNAETDIASIEGGVKQLYAGQGNYNGLTNQVAVNAGVFPVDMVGTGTPVDSWQGAVTLEPGTDVSANYGGDFAIQMANVSQSACIKLATYQYGSWVAFSINGTSLYSPGSPVAVGSSPTPLASGDCTPGSTNTLLWIVG